MAKYGMVIDLNTCFRCRTCMVACKVANKIPTVFDIKEQDTEYYRMRPVEWEEGKFPNVKRISIPISCMHCDNPACKAVCPVNAISKRDDGIVVVDKEKCIGCGACIEACPYNVPYLMDEKADRCDFCSDRRAKGQQPYCVETCPCKAMVFGDLDDPKSDVSRLVNSNGKVKPLLPEAGTRPNVYFVVPNWYEDEWNKLGRNSRFMEALS